MAYLCAVNDRKVIGYRLLVIEAGQLPLQLSTLNHQKAMQKNTRRTAEDDTPYREARNAVSRVTKRRIVF